MCEAIFDGKDNRGVVWDRFPVRSAKPQAAVQAKEGIRLGNRDTVFKAEAAEFGAISVKAGVAVHAGTFCFCASMYSRRRLTVAKVTLPPSRSLCGKRVFLTALSQSVEGEMESSAAACSISVRSAISIMPTQ